MGLAFCTRICGLANDRISVMSSFLRSFSASAASSKAGMAASKATSASPFSTAISADVTYGSTIIVAWVTDLTVVDSGLFTANLPLSTLRDTMI